MVVLQLRSNTTKPFPAEDLKPETLPSNNAVIAGIYNVSAFESNSFDVVIGMMKKKQRRRRAADQDALDILQPNMTARFSQLNYHLQNVSWKTALVMKDMMYLKHICSETFS